jgi:cation diffusion facilitator CzcD-associated flavoprotein CzcO
MASADELARLERVREKYAAERAKRLDPERGAILDRQEFRDYFDDPFTEFREREPVHDHVDALVIGAGLGGLIAGARLREIGVDRIRIVDTAGDVGGVWYWNRYPGAQCDVESYIYLPFLEETGYVPKLKYSYGPEIRAYTQLLARHFDLYQLALFQTTITSLTWDADAGRWEVSTDRGDEFTTRYVILMQGAFSIPKLPAIPGIETFQGAMFHSARWDYGYTGDDLANLADKTVGLIGTGATGIQIVAPVGEAAKQLYVFQRTPSTVAERNNRETDVAWFTSQPPGWLKERAENFTMITNGESVEEDLVHDGWTVFYKAILGSGEAGLGPEEQALKREEFDLAHMEHIRARVDSIVSDPETAAALKPYYRYQCKRPAFHDQFLPAFNRSNVSLVDTNGLGIDRITERGVVVNGREYELDCLVIATGFDQDADFTDRIGFDITGVGGQKLSEKWKDGPLTLHAVMTSGFPNFFMRVTRDYHGTSGVNLVHTLEEANIHFARVIAALERRGVIADPTPEAELEYVESIMGGRHVLVGSADLLQNCTPGYYNYEGRLQQKGPLYANYPGTAMSFFRMLRQWRESSEFSGLKLTAAPAPIPE